MEFGPPQSSLQIDAPDTAFDGDAVKHAYS